MQLSDLMSRGMSFVSTKDDTRTAPLAATTMIYVPGKNMHLVGLAQSIGRICGNARPELQRRLYTTQSVIDNYCIFNQNQKQYLKAIRESNGILSCKIIKEIELNNKPTRAIDRAALGLKFQYKMVSEDIDDDGRIDGVKLKDLRRWLDQDNWVGKMIRFLYENESVNFIEFKNGIGYEGSENEFNNTISNGRGKNTVYGKLWSYKNRVVQINQKIKNYIDTLR